MKFFEDLKKLFFFIYDKWTRPELRLEDEQSIQGKLVLITGGDGEIGRETVLQLAKRGARIILACLDVNQGQKVVQKIREKTSLGELFVHHLDLSSLSSVRSFATEITDLYPKINILINNAGIANTHATTFQELKMTRDNFELHMAVNFFGPFLLTNLLYPHMEENASSRIIFTASTMHTLANLKLDSTSNFARLEGLEFLGHLNEVPYANSKFSLMLFAQELGQRLKKVGISTYSVCPGIVMSTIFNNCPWSIWLFVKLISLIGGYGPKEGCKTLVYCATSKKCSGETGKMYRFNKIYSDATKNLENLANFGAKLCKISEKLVGLES